MKACQYCRCTEAQACDGGCAWANPEETICTLCASAAETASELVRVLGAVVDQAKVGMSLAFLVWEQLTLEQQRVMVMTCRATVDAIRQALLETMAEEVLEANAEITLIANFLTEKCRPQLDEEETVSANVIRLLEPHVGSRIVLPAGLRP